MNDASLIGINGKAEPRGLCWRTFLCLLIGLLAIGLGEAIAAAPANQPIKKNVPMSYAEARHVLIQLWENQKPDSSTYHYDKLTVTFIGKDKLELYKSLISSVTGARSFKYTFDLTEMNEPYIRKQSYWDSHKGYLVAVNRGIKYESSHNMFPIIFPLESQAEAFVRALSVLRQYAIKEKEILASEASSFAAFQEKAKTWRALKVKPELPPDVRRFRLLAEDSIKHQEFEKAVQYYEQGLEIEPLWPQGQYNVALLYGEMREYRNAELHMKRYLELVPDAPDAQAARDQMMIWQSKMNQ